MKTLQEILVRAVSSHRAHPAIVEGNGTGQVDYHQLDRLSDRVRDRLAASGVGRGDRVGLYLRKSADGVASILGILKSGAAYVPVDPSAPAVRNAYIHADCNVKVAIVERRYLAAYQDELAKLGANPVLIVLDDVGGGGHLQMALDRLDDPSPATPVVAAEASPDDLAYILYTSGSTGKPKGVMLSHRNAVTFIDWCSEVFAPESTDVFSSHAPLHFDLSILDLYVPLKHGATLVLVPEDVGKDPRRLTQLIAERRLTVWYSAPSTLALMAQFGRILEYDFSSLRLILFAGEVFPVGHLRSLKEQLPKPRYFNLYGPTETNVCTWYEVPATIPAERAEPYPIGKVCAHLEGIVVDADGRRLAPDDEGELCIAGDHVMQGYWGLAEQTARAFLPDDGSGKRWYRTGDIVRADLDGDYRYLGRRDRMVKKRGYRVELGEIEACLYRHAQIREAGVVAVPDDAGSVKVRAHISIRGDRRPSLIELKGFCSQHLPAYMVPDVFAFHEALPRTSTDKVDYVRLNSQA